MNPGSYLQRYQGIHSGASTPKDEFLDDNYSDTSSISKGRQLSLETNKRRRQMAMKIKEDIEIEERRRKEILAKRRHEQKLITEKFQRKRRSQSARKAQHQQGTLEDALQAVKYSGCDKNIGLRRTGSFDSLQARIDPWAAEQDARKNRQNTWEVEQEVLIKNNHTYLEKYGAFATKPNAVDKTPQSIFEKKLEKHQNAVLLQQQKKLQEFSQTLERAFYNEDVNTNSVHSPTDSLEEEDSTYRMNKLNSSLSSAKSSENSTYRVMSCEDLDPDAVIQDPSLFLPMNSDSSNGHIQQANLNSSFDQKVTNPNTNHSSMILSHNQADLFDVSNSKPIHFPKNANAPMNNVTPETEILSNPSESNSKSSKIPVPVSSPVKDKYFNAPTISKEITSPSDENEASSRFVVVEKEKEETNNNPGRDASMSATVSQPKSILKSLKARDNSDASLLVQGLKGEIVRDSIEVAHTSANIITKKENTSVSSTDRDKSKSVRFAETLCEDLEEKFERWCQLQDAEKENGLPPRAASAPLNRGRSKSSIKRIAATPGHFSRPPRAPKRSTAPKMVSLVGMPVKLRSTRPQKITSSTLDRLTETHNENKDDISITYDGPIDTYQNDFNPFLEENINGRPPDSSEMNATTNTTFPINNGDRDNLVFTQQNISQNHKIPQYDALSNNVSNNERFSVDDVDLSVSEQSDSQSQNQIKEKGSGFDPTVGRTPTEDEIDQLWEHVRSCLKPSPPPESTVTSDLSVISAPNSFRRQLTSPVPMPPRTNNAWTTEHQQIFKANQNRVQTQLSHGLRIIHHTSSIPSKRTPLSIQRETRSKPVVKPSLPSDKVSDSLAEFLNAERLCQSPGDILNNDSCQTSVRQPLQPPQNLLVTRKRMVARQQMSPVSLTPIMSPVPQTNNTHPLLGPPSSASQPTSQRSNPPSALSVEEDRIMKSLDRLNDRLNTVTLQN